MIIFLIEQYQKYLSPFFGRQCRFWPSCSDYAKEAIRKRGIFKGAAVALKRLLKCQPFHPGGIDVLES